MASYKVIQDVEAEDKLLGPLTLRQFIYAGAASLLLYISYFAATHSATFLIVIFLPMAAILAFFAFPWGRDQPTEIWALAKIRYLLKPRRRIWDQSGAKDLVTVTAPKHTRMDYTNGLSETEVRSRLHALADTIDSRGWAIKNSNLNLYTQPALVMAEPTSDRLLGPAALPQEVTNIDVRAADDILDEKNNARAQAVNTMIEKSAREHREQIVQSLKQPVFPQPSAQAPAQPAVAGQQGGAAAPNPSSRPNDYWFLNQPARSANVPANMVTFNTQVVTPGMAGGAAATPTAPANGINMEADEQNLARALAAKQQEMPTTAYYSHLHTIQPLSAQQPQPPVQQQFVPPQPQQPVAPQMPQVQPVSIPQPPQQAMPPQQDFQLDEDGLPPFGMPLPHVPMDQTGSASFAPPPTAAAPQPVPTIARPWEPTNPTPAPVTPANQAAILQLANNNDLNVATIAREADRSAPDEVVINLH